MIYLDNNASTPVDPEVANVMDHTLRRHFGNPSSSHYAGVAAKTVVEEARLQVARLIGCNQEEVFFTSGGTESNNLAILGTARRKEKGHLITSVVEHPAVINPCRHLEDSGFALTYVGVDKTGRADLDAIRRSIRKDTILITLMHANNETGVIQPVEEVAALAKERGISFHSDAAQSIGKIPVNVSEMGCDMMTIAAHKFYGPKGVGALFLRKGVGLSPILFGAGHERGFRPGTENVAGVAGLGKACEMSANFGAVRMSQMKTIADELYRGLLEKIGGIRLNGHEILRLPNTLNISIEGIDSFDLLERIKGDVAASSGSACHSGRKSPSAVLKAMGVPDTDAMSSIRLSAGKDNTSQEIEEAVEILVKAVKELRGP